MSAHSLDPLQQHNGKDLKLECLDFPFFKDGTRHLLLVLHLTSFLAAGDPRQARGTHINVRKPHAMGPLILELAPRIPH